MRKCSSVGLTGDELQKFSLTSSFDYTTLISDVVM